MRVEKPGRAVTGSFAADVRAGLGRREQKELPCKYLYDDVGSALFEVLSLLPEYGLTRAGDRLLREHSDELLAWIRSPTLVAELGSGSGKRTRFILEPLSRREPTTYCPIEISAAALARCELELGRLDALSIMGFEREYLDGLRQVAARRREEEHFLVLFLGSTIGNFDRLAADEFLRQIRAVLTEGDALLLATDLVKPVPLLIQAYDDPLGVTAAFNLNLLARINRELGGDFDLTRFRHVVRYDERERRIEMHLCSTLDHKVSIPRADLEIRFRKDETIWTESSHKYNVDEIRGMAQRSGYRVAAHWLDHEWPFAHSLLLAV